MPPTQRPSLCLAPVCGGLVALLGLLLAGCCNGPSYTYLTTEGGTSARTGLVAEGYFDLRLRQHTADTLLWSRRTHDDMGGRFSLTSQEGLPTQLVLAETLATPRVTGDQGRYWYVHQPSNLPCLSPLADESAYTITLPQLRHLHVPYLEGRVDVEALESDEPIFMSLGPSTGYSFRVVRTPALYIQYGGYRQSFRLAAVVDTLMLVGQRVARRDDALDEPFWLFLTGAADRLYLDVGGRATAQNLEARVAHIVVRDSLDLTLRATDTLRLELYDTAGSVIRLLNTPQAIDTLAAAPNHKVRVILE